jgi:predicted MFS family arabinose efflux permease
VLLQAAWSFTAPFLLSLAAEIEPAGSLMIPANFVLGAGLAAGPLITGFVLEANGGFGAAAGLGTLLLLAGLILLWTYSRLNARPGSPG